MGKVSVKISLIIPVYNQKETMQVVFESIRKQENIEKEMYEIILVNDGDGQEYEDIFEEYLNCNVHIIYHDTNLGRAAARNSGARLAQGDILIFNDGDRFLSPRFIWNHYISHKRGKDSVVIGDIDRKSVV